MKKLLLLISVLFTTINFAQIGIGTTNPQAALDITNTNDGLLIPRVSLISTSSALPLSAPTDSELIYNTASINDVTPGYYYWNGTTWTRLLSSQNDDWSKTGNTGTNPGTWAAPGTNFIGTTDAQGLFFRTNNINRMSIDGNGKIQFGGNTTSNARLYIDGSDISSDLSLYNNYTSNYSGIFSATYAFYNRNASSTTKEKNGIYNEITGSGENSKSGILNYIFSGNTAASLGIYGVTNRLRIRSTNTTIQTNAGVLNDIQFTSTNSRGDFNGLSNNISTINNVSSTHAETIKGINNDFSIYTSGTTYGAYTVFANGGSGNKYGYFVSIPSTAGGTHYGIYSDVVKVGGSYAGYFLGNVSIGTTSGNEYILPSSRGAIGQTMITDGSGNVSWSTPTSNIVTISTPDYTVLTTDSSVILTTAATGIITLPTAASSTGKVINLVNYSGADKTLSIAVNVGSGGTTTTTLINDTRMTIQSNGTDWYRIM